MVVIQPPVSNWQTAPNTPVAPAPYKYFDPDTLGDRLDTVISLLEALLVPTTTLGATGSTPGQTFGISTVAKTPFQLTAAPLVKIAYLQNIQSFNITKGVVNTMVDGVGFILNGSATGAGDTQVIGPQGTDAFVDLSKYWFTANTTGTVLVCDYLQ